MFVCVLACDDVTDVFAKAEDDADTGACVEVCVGIRPDIGIVVDICACGCSCGAGDTLDEEEGIEEEEEEVEDVEVSLAFKFISDETG